MKNTAFSDKLKELRKAHNYNQLYVSTALGISRQTYSHYETGIRTPNPETIYKLAGLYEVSVDELMQLLLMPDENTYYDAPAPSPSTNELSDFLEYINKPQNHKKFHLLNHLEKQLLYYFEKISEDDRKEIIEFTKIKAKKPYK